MKSTPTLLRRAEHQALATVTLSGKVLDVGGAKHAEYLSYLKGDFTTEVVNLDLGTEPEYVYDLEKPLPIADATYDHVIAINVFEHVYRYQQLLSESVRVLKPGGSLTIVVPFLFPVHLDPGDFWRFSYMTLQRAFEDAGMKDIRIEPLGSGVFAARYVLLDRLLPSSVRFIRYYSIRYIATTLDALFVSFARATGKKYIPSDYALGYLVTAQKHS